MEKLLELKNVSKRFPLGGGKYSFALNGVNLSVYRGETLGILGESGCGKSTLARVIMGVYPPTEGELLFEGQPLVLKHRHERKKFARRAQMIFQDPYLSLDPHMIVKDIIAENLEIHGIGSKNQQERRVYELLELTGLLREYAQRFPHEFSGGQRQRIGIARALAIQPDFIVCDEPISSLDSGTRGQIIELLLRLKASLGLTYLFIAHDINIIRHISNRVAVMYAGRIVELGTAQEVCAFPAHPYTQMLLSSCLPSSPTLDWLERQDIAQGEVPSSAELETGCSFKARCSLAVERCGSYAPTLSPVTANHLAACWRVNAKA